MSFNSNEDHKKYLELRKYDGNPFQLALMRIMEKRKMTQADVCRDVGLDHRVIHNYLRGKSLPSFKNASKIMFALFDKESIINVIIETNGYSI